MNNQPKETLIYLGEAALIIIGVISVIYLVSARKDEVQSTTTEITLTSSYDLTTPLSTITSSTTTLLSTTTTETTTTSTRPTTTSGSTTGEPCVWVGYWCSDPDWQNVVEIENVKDPYKCQEECQNIKSYPCQFFSWDSVTYDCNLSKECEKIWIGYMESGPKYC